MFRIGQNGDALEAGDNVPQDLDSLAVELGGEQGHPGHIAARPRQALGKASRDRIAAEDKDAGRRQTQLAHGRGRRALDDDQIDTELDELVGQGRHPLEGIVTVAIVDGEVSPLDIAELRQARPHRSEIWCQARGLLCRQPADPDGPCGRLPSCTSGQRQPTQGGR